MSENINKLGIFLNILDAFGHNLTLRPTSFVQPDTASQPQEQSQTEETQQPEGDTGEKPTQTAGEAEVDLPATQPYEEDAERRPTTTGGGSQPTEQLDSQVHQMG